MPKREPEKAAFFAGKAAIGTRNFDASRRSRAARLCRAACAHSAQGNQKGQAQKRARSFWGLPFLIPVARELAWRPKPIRRKPVCSPYL